MQIKIIWLISIILLLGQAILICLGDLTLANLFGAGAGSCGLIGLLNLTHG